MTDLEKFARKAIKKHKDKIKKHNFVDETEDVGKQLGKNNNIPWADASVNNPAGGGVENPNVGMEGKTVQ
jgi:hypothetical protein